LLLPSVLLNRFLDGELQRLESRQGPQRSVVLDEIRDAHGQRADFEPLASTTLKATSLTQEIVQHCLGIGQLFQPGKRRKLEDLLAVGVACRPPDGSLIKKQPGFLHSNRNNTYVTRHPPLERCFDEGYLDFVDTVLKRHFLGVAVDKQQIARVKVDRSRNAIGKFSR
jgi:hypothetical protein